MLLLAAGTLGGMLILSLILNQALTNELIMVDFRQGSEPFEIGEHPDATFDLVGGTYRLVVKKDNVLITTLGEFRRTAYAVGVRGDVQAIEPATTVGVMCLGPAGEETGGLGGYGFFVESGGHFVLGRQEPSGRVTFLKEGEAVGIDEPRRMSVTCLPELNGDVSLTGYVNGRQVVAWSDPDGYGQYTYAGLGLAAEHVGGEVRFTRVSARVPDEEWVP